MAARDDMIGASILGRYRIVARLAQGGMGVVYLARSEGAAGFAKPVVVKRVLPGMTGDERMTRLFVREAKILSNMQHPNIVGVTDFGEEDGAHIMVLDYVRAYQLGLWLAYREEQHQLGKGERLPIEGIVHIVIKVLDALEYSHGLTLPDGSPLEIVHSDVSPANILVDGDGQVKLLDFGIARMKGEQTRTTDDKSIRGKFSYLPIEALDGSPPTPMTDVYACGVVLYELLTGENPFTGADETRTIARVISHEPPPVSQVRPGVSPELDAVVARAMSKDKTKRFANAKEFARELRRVQAVPEDEAARALGTLAKADYAAMPMREGSSLAELEETWRNPPAVASEPRLGPAGPPKGAESAVTATAAEAPPPRGRGVIVAVAALGALLVIGGVGLALFLGRRQEEPKLLVIERTANGSATPTTTTEPAPDTTTSTTAPSSASAAPRPSQGKPPKPAAGDPLSAAFAKNQPDIEACFTTKAPAAGTPDISVRFSIDTEGVVQRAEISPADVASSPLGACIAGVARRTRFPAQAAPATFRIPLRARKQ